LEDRQETHLFSGAKHSRESVTELVWFLIGVQSIELVVKPWITAQNQTVRYPHQAEKNAPAWPMTSNVILLSQRRMSTRPSESGLEISFDHRSRSWKGVEFVSNALFLETVHLESLRSEYFG
jgi:hypothetical protein